MHVRSLKGCVECVLPASKIHFEHGRAHFYLDFNDAQEVARALHGCTFEPAEPEPVITEEEWINLKNAELVREEAVYEYMRKKED